MAKSKGTKAGILAVKRDYWERLRRNLHYQKDYQHLISLASKDDFFSDKTIDEVAAMARYYYLVEMIDPKKEFSNEIAHRIRFTDALIRLKVHKGYWPLSRSSFCCIGEINDDGKPILAPYKRSESLIFGRYLQIAVDITQPMENAILQVRNAIKMARSILIDDYTAHSHKNMRHRPIDNENALKAWDMRQSGKKLPDIGQELWNIKNREDAKRRAYDAVQRAETLIKSVASAASVDLKGQK